MLVDVDTANFFKDKFRKELGESDYDLDFVHNTNEPVMSWKSLPSISSRPETSAPGYRTSRERVTILVCVSATEKHKMPLHLIGKSTKPKLFKNSKFQVSLNL